MTWLVVLGLVAFAAAKVALGKQRRRGRRRTGRPRGQSRKPRGQSRKPRRQSERPQRRTTVTVSVGTDRDDPDAWLSTAFRSRFPDGDTYGEWPPQPRDGDDTADQRLSPNGRFVAVVGRGGFDAPSTASAMVVVEVATRRVVGAATGSQLCQVQAGDEGGFLAIDGPLDASRTFIMGQWRHDSRPWVFATRVRVFGSAVSPDGDRAYVVTGYGDDGPQQFEGLLLVLRLSDGEAEWIAPAPERVRWSGQTLQTKTPAGWLGYSDDGSLPDADNPLAGARLVYIESVLADVNDRIKQGSADWRTSEARDAVEQLRVWAPRLPDGAASRAYRAVGEVAEQVGDRHEAVRLWSKAIALNPKVGIKRRLDQLRKEVGG